MRNCYAIRVKEEERIEVQKRIDPNYAEIIGDALLTMNKGDGIRIAISGVPYEMDNAVLTKQLTMDTLTVPWRCKPCGTAKSATRGKKTVIAIVERLPPRSVVQMKIGHELIMVEIQEHQTPQNRLTVWDRVCAKAEESQKDTEHDSMLAGEETRQIAPNTWANKSGFWARAGGEQDSKPGEETHQKAPAATTTALGAQLKSKPSARWAGTGQNATNTFWTTKSAAEVSLPEEEDDGMVSACETAEPLPPKIVIPFLLKDRPGDDELERQRKDELFDRLTDMDSQRECNRLDALKMNKDLEQKGADSE